MGSGSLSGENSGLDAAEALKAADASLFLGAVVVCVGGRFLVVVRLVLFPR